MDEVAEQEEAARKFEAAIAAVEPFVVQSEGGEFSFGEADLTSLDVDPEAIQSLIASVDELNTSLSSGALALEDVQTSTPGIANV
jgi:hypothetical protein